MQSQQNIDLNEILLSAEMHQSNETRLRRWRVRYHRATGILPTPLPFIVRPCIDCNAPVWLINPRHNHFRSFFCEKHDIPEFLKRQSGI